ncbi:recombinase family protein [Streptomyces sp. SRF1]|nr:MULTISPECIES: recombinase family protein [unclassified Streptomyces]MDN3058281.1 recombinase family protein [Streptomyces sp. SRF1]
MKVIEQIVRDLLEGKTASAVAEALNAEGAPSPRGYWALMMARATGGRTGGRKGVKGEKAPSASGSSGRRA